MTDVGCKCSVTDLQEYPQGEGRRIVMSTIDSLGDSILVKVFQAAHAVHGAKFKVNYVYNICGGMVAAANKATVLQPHDYIVTKHTEVEYVLLMLCLGSAKVAVMCKMAFLFLH
jgi:hypothetical protein